MANANKDQFDSIWGHNIGGGMIYFVKRENVLLKPFLLVRVHCFLIDL
jgi:hypothetical protein